MKLTEAEVEAAIGPLDAFAHNCHTASLALVRSDLFEFSRVARGAARGVTGQHSWVMLGDCYDDEATIVDVTLWSYDPSKPRVWVGTLQDGLHAPHGRMSIYSTGKPVSAGGEIVELSGLSASAQAFLNLLGPLDHRGWAGLASGGMLGWPSREIIAAMAVHPSLSTLVPIDIVGMLTDLNPSNLYLKHRGPEEAV